MRWPFRRRGRAGDVAVATTPVPPPAAVRRTGRDWAALPPLRPASAPAAPLISGAPPVLPPLPGPRAVVSAEIAPAAGRVEGLATVQPARTADGPPPGPVPETVQQIITPLVHRAAAPAPAAASRYRPSRPRAARGARRR